MIFIYIFSVSYVLDRTSEWKIMNGGIAPIESLLTKNLRLRIRWNGTRNNVFNPKTSNIHQLISHSFSSIIIKFSYENFSSHFESNYHEEISNMFLVANNKQPTWWICGALVETLLADNIRTLAMMRINRKYIGKSCHVFRHIIHLVSSGCTNFIVFIFDMFATNAKRHAESF